MIEYILNGKPVKVRPEHKELFEKNNPTATPKSEEVGKSQGTSQSQNNQQKTNTTGPTKTTGPTRVTGQLDTDTESNLVDGSLGLQKPNKIPKRNIEKLPDENFFDSKKSDIISQERELYQLEEDLVGINYEDKAKGFSETSDNYKKQLKNIEDEINKIVNGKYETEKSYNLAKLQLEEKQKEHETIRKNHNDNLTNWEELDKQYTEQYNNYEKSLIKYNDDLGGYKELTGKGPLELDKEEKESLTSSVVDGNASQADKLKLIKDYEAKNLTWDPRDPRAVRSKIDKKLKNIVEGGADLGVGFVKSLASFYTNPKEIPKTLALLNQRKNDVPERLLQQAISSAAVLADVFTRDLDGIQTDREEKIRKEGEEVILKAYEALDKLEPGGEGINILGAEFKTQYEGKGIVGGLRAGSGADYIAGLFDAVLSVGETMVPAMATGGASLPFQIAAPFYTDYNEEKAKRLYPDDPDSMKKLLDNDEAELLKPLSLGLVATLAEGAGIKGISNAIKAAPGKSGAAMRFFAPSFKEASTEWWQGGLETMNVSLGAGKPMAEASKDMWNHMLSDQGLEEFLSGFVGGGAVTVGGRAINRALRNDNISLKEIDNQISNIAELNSRKNLTRSKEVKESLDLEIKDAQSKLKKYINEKRKIGEVLTKEQKDNLVNILDEKDGLTSKADALKAQLAEGKISKKEYGYAIRGLNNQDKKLSSQIVNIKNQALEAAAERTTETVKKQIKEMDLEGEVETMTTSEIKDFMKEEGFDDDAATQSSNEFGLIKQMPDGSFQIVLNKDKPMEGTAAHEFLHAVLFKTLDGNTELQTSLGSALEEHVVTLGGDLSNVGKRLAQYGDWVKDKDGNITGFEKDANFGEETITIMSESILDGSLKFNEGFFTKIGDIIRRFGQNYLGQEIEFNTGRDVYNFIKDYNNSIKTGKVNKAIVKVAKEGAKGKLLEKADTKTTKPTKKETIQKSKDVSPSINEMGRMAWTNKTWKESGANFAIEEMKRDKMLDGLILAAQAKANPSFQIKNQNDEIKNKFVDDVYTQLTSHVKNFKPEDQGESGLFGWINPQLGNKALDVQKRPEYSGDKLTRAKDITEKTEEGAPKYQVADTALNPEEMMIAAEEAAAAKEKLDRVSKETLEKKLGLDEKADKEFEQALVTAFGTKLPKVDSKKLRTELRKIVADKLRPKIQKLFGREKSYDNFIQEDLPSLLGFIKVDDLVQIERLVGGKKFPNGRKILASKKRITSVKEVRRLQGTLDEQGVPLIDPRIKPESGPSLKRRLNPTSKELLAAFRGTSAEKILGYQPPGSMDSGMLGARKDRLAELLVGEIAFNKAIQVAQQQLEKIQAIEEIQNRNIEENYIAELGVTLDRDPTIQHSKATVVEQTDLLENLVSELGIENVIENGKVLDGFPVMSKAAIQMVEKLYDSNVIMSESAKAFKQSISKSDIIPTWLKNQYEAVGNLRYNDTMLDQMHKDSSIVALELGPEIMNLINYDILGYTNRLMDPAAQKTGKPKGVKGKFHDRLVSTKEKVNKKKVKLPPGLILEDVRVMNKSLPLFKKIEKILALKSKKEKLAKLKALKPEIDKANTANIKLAKHIAKTVIKLAKLGPKKGGIKPITALNILQSQTSIVKGFRGLSRLDLIDVREGSQTVSEAHPQYKQALTYYKNKGKGKGKNFRKLTNKEAKEKALERVGSKGEHLAPNSNTMKAIAELMFKKDVDIDTELDLIFSKHSQLLTSKFIADVIDDGPGGKTSTADFNRIKYLKKSDINNIVSADGRSYQDVLGDVEINSMQLGFVNNIIIQRSKAGGDKINNAIDAFNKQAELIKKQNKEIQADLEKRGYKFSKTGDIEGQTPGEMIKIMQADLEAKGYTFVDMDNKGMSTFDFDETLIIDGENFVVATDPKTGEKINIKSGDWPIKGPELAAQGYEFNFNDFVNVRGGKDGPLLQKMKNQIKKYGVENVFVLTARPQTADVAIHEWLKSKGIDIPFKNITGLANSTGQAKADWMLDKFAEGYNDMYFVDDALPNVQAVKEVLDQLDIKSKVVQAKIKFSRTAPLEFNEILEQSKGMPAKRIFSAQEAKKIGVGKGKNIFKNFYVPPSAEDFKGLLYRFIGRGEQGNAHAAFFKEKLLDPFARGSREWNSYKQAMSDDYKALKKQFKKVGKKLNKKVKGTVFTNDNAIRVYLWDKAGFEIPGLSESQKQKLVNHIENNPELKNFAEGLSVVSRVQEGYIQPSDFWAVESIGSDLTNIVRKVGREQFFAEWIENKNIIFSPENLNKIEAIYGTGFRNELEKMLYRMETGQNRTTGKDDQVNMLLDWINGSVGAVMFFNMRSASLQTISMANFINMADNNPVAAAKALANVPQYIKDFSYIFNSDMLKQRRAGLQIDVSANELTSAFKDGKSKPQAIIHYLLEKGFTPTQIADSFAIAAGGATFYRNRLNKLIKDGMSETKAKEQAWLDFQEIAEETQQSSRPDLISNQQAGPLGRLILAWQNTPMQMTRLQKKKLSDLINRRRIPGYTQFQSDMANISGIAYYGLIQNIYFGALQTGLMFMLFGWDEDEERKEKLELRVANGAFDSILRGTGIYGAGISTLKNVLLKWKEEREKPGWKRENMNIAQELVNLSPPMGTKMRKIMQAIRTEEYNKGVSKELGFRIENPNISIAANWTEALTNLPVARLLNKANNIEEAITGNHQTWQRVALLSGWSMWSLGVIDEELEKAKEAVKAKRKKAGDIKRDIDKTIKKAIKEDQDKIKKKAEEEKKKKEGIKTVRCSGSNSSGKRCGLTTETNKKSWKCFHHSKFEDGMDRDNDGKKEYRCVGIKKDGKRCNNKGEYGKEKLCYAHK